MQAGDPVTHQTIAVAPLAFTGCPACAGHDDSERPLHRLDAIALDHVALPHVLIALERHAAFLAGDHLAHVVLEALELRELAFVDHDVVADQPHVRAALDLAVGDAATGDL